jgi:hypothetical protein
VIVFLNGVPSHIHNATFFGAIEDASAFEDLYRLDDETWLLNIQHRAPGKPSVARRISQEEAVEWLLQLRQSPRGGRPGLMLRKRQSESIPQNAIGYSDPGRLTAGSVSTGAGQHRLLLPEDSKTMTELRDRQDSILQPGNVLEKVLWAPAADEAATAGFKDKSHAELIQLLRTQLEERLLHNPKISTFQSLQDRGCDVLIEWGPHAKYGLQIKSHGDIAEKDFAKNTLSQVQDSRQHGLQKLYVLLAGDLTDQSQEQKVRGLHSRISAMNDPYVSVIPPERAWSIISGNP